MEVKPGCKQTEVGVIPEDWDVKPLHALANIRSGLAKNSNTTVSDPIRVHYLRVANVQDGFLDLTDMSQIEVSRSDLNRFSVLPGDVLMNEGGDLDKLGRGSIWRGELQPCIHQNHVFVVRCGSFVSPEYLTIWSSGTKARRYFLIAGKQTTNLASINKTSLGELPVVLPAQDEQRAIATALSDMDALLDGLGRLIAKKRAIKQATMQQLLTGQTRLPGFSGEWEEKRLGDHLTFLRNGVNSRAELSYSEDVRYLHYGDIHGSSRVELNPANVEMPCLPRAKASRLDRLQNGDLIFADASEDMDGVGKSVEIQNAVGIELVSGLHTIAIRLDKSVLADGFKAYIQFIPKFRAHLRQLATGTKVYATNRTHIASAELRLPGIDEQQAISALLTDMDAEITALENRHTKTRALKQAMMQELLTGRTRLVKSAEKPDEEAAAQTAGRKANVHFLRSVLAAEIIDQLHDQPTFGHVKFEKMMFLAEHLCQVDTGSIYHRKAAGPYDNRALRSIDSQLQKQQWFEARKQDGRYQYVPLAKRGGHKPYFERHFSGIAENLEEILGTFKTAKTEQCEIVATLLAAWSDLLREQGTVSDEMIVHEVLHNWHEAKQRIPEDRWLAALGWMRQKGFVPKGATLP